MKLQKQIFPTIIFVIFFFSINAEIIGFPDNVNSYRIKMPSKFKASGFYDEVVYESLIYKLNSFERIYERISKDKIELSSLIGNNGVISKFNFKKKAKTIDKTTIKE